MSLCAIMLLTARRLIDSRSWRFFVGSVFLLSVLSVTLSLSRGSALALAPALVLLWATRGNSINPKRIFAAILISALMMALLFTAIRGFRVGAGGTDLNSQRNTEIAQSVEDFTRYEAATYSLKKWSEHPLFGVGFMLFPGINYNETGFYITTHDTVLELLVGTGRLIGLVLIAWYTCSTLEKTFLRGKPVLAFLPVFVCFFINSLFGDFAQAFELIAVLSVAYLVANRDKYAIYKRSH